MGKDFLSNINSIKMPGEYPISKYRKVIKKADPAQESEIRVRVNSPPFAYAAYAGKLLLQKDFDYVYLNATGAAVSNSIKVIEYLKTHIKGLHISYNILSKEFVDEYEPKVEGLDKVTTTRTVSTLEAKLTIKKGEELAKEVGYMAPSANEDDIDQKGFEDSMAKYNERKATKQDGGDRRGGDRRGGDRRPRTQSGKYNDNEERKEGGNGGERRTNNYDNREGGDRRRYNNDNRDGGDRRRNDNRDGGDRRNDNRDVKRYDNRDNRDNRNRDNYNKDNRDEKRYDNRDNRDNRNRDNYTKTDNYQKDDRRTDDRRDGGDNRRGGDRRDGGDRNYDNRRREDGDNRGGRGRGGDRGGRGRGGDRGDRRGGDRRENDNRNENYQKDYKNDRD